ncbi:hypothetical protein NLD30_08260 [SCandidatus Aminicenantes bacterium Aminicenantia_JdfR_composite]|jgi:hypothetical protein|nr:hypothetical protein [SCandidatus Aminicenantes bacterium Aminicenantia_JdfR_composite]MCP2596864.1 hypothetical protein [Candidatus Aminicenantes bacterium AC-335-G13]MCP2605524.1 hypothetical protein [Candidatus Aminicenantes bacterium AC-335-O07]
MPGTDVGGPTPPGLWTKFENKKVRVILNGEVKVEFDALEIQENPVWSDIKATIERDEIISGLNKLFEPLNYTWYYSVTDKTFRCYDIGNVRYFLNTQVNDLNSTLYIDEYFDCDDFAQVLEGRINLYYKGIAFGTFYYKSADPTQDWSHAVNIFCQKKGRKIEFYLIDPITKQIFKYDKKKISPVLVII